MEKTGKKFSDDRLGLMAYQIAKRFVDDCLADIDEVWGLESGLVGRWSICWNGRLHRNLIRVSPP